MYDIMHDIESIKAAWQGRLIVSCQADKGDPLDGCDHIAALARAAQLGGAAGLRIDSPQNIKAVRACSQLPIVGSYKIHSPDSTIYVTPTYDNAVEVVSAGADVVGIQATSGKRSSGEHVNDIIAHIHDQLGAAVCADVSNLDEALAVAQARPDFVTTAFCGHKPYSPAADGFDDRLLRQLVEAVDIPIVAEGWINTPDQAAAAMAQGAFAVVVGSAITRPQKITERFVRAIERC